MTDYPFYEICNSVQEQIILGHECYQKFTCAKCGNRLTIEIPNVMYASGSCDKCGHITNIEKQGCNYCLVMHTNKPRIKHG